MAGYIVGSAKMNSTCPRCNFTFSAEENRRYAIQRQQIDKRWWRITFLYFALKEFENYQIIECPNCYYVYKENKLKVFRYFTPNTVVRIIVVINVIVYVMAIYYFFHKFVFLK